MMTMMTMMTMMMMKMKMETMTRMEGEKGGKRREESRGRCVEKVDLNMETSSSFLLLLEVDCREKREREKEKEGKNLAKGNGFFSGGSLDVVHDPSDGFVSCFRSQKM